MNHLPEMFVFARVVETRSFTTAAAQLGLTTSAVSRSVSRLERHIGGKLLSRSTRAMALTELGRDVSAACAEIASTASAIESLARHQVGTPRGVLKISAPIAYAQSTFVSEVVDFMTRWPDITIDLDVTDRIVDVVGEGFDLVIRLAAQLPPGMIARRLGESRHMLVAHPAYLDSKPRISTPRDLASHSLILGSRIGEDVGSLTLKRGSEQVEVHPSSRLKLSNGMGVSGAVLEGLGIGLVNDFVAREAFRTGALVQVLPQWELEGAHAPLPLQVVYAPTRHVPSKVRSFIDYLVERHEHARMMSQHALVPAGGHQEPAWHVTA